LWVFYFQKTKLVCVFREIKKTKFLEIIWVPMLAMDFILGCTE